MWGDARDVETGVKEIVIRAREALDGVPNETRQAFPDGTHGFERILPGADRMYPDTDLPPLAITESRIQRIRSIMAERPWDREERYRGMGIPPEVAARLSVSDDRDLFDRAAKETGYPPGFLAAFFVNRLRMLRRAGTIAAVSGDGIVATLKAAAAREVPVENLVSLLEKSCGADALDPDAAIEALGLESPKKVEKDIASFLKTVDLPDIAKDKLKRHVMGLVMYTYRGALPGKKISDIVDAFIA